VTRYYFLSEGCCLKITVEEKDRGKAAFSTKMVIGNIRGFPLDLRQPCLLLKKIYEHGVKWAYRIALFCFLG
jgi:hypothetical protein